jgi:hypothetical protein
VRPDKGHAKAILAPEGRLHIGHELQGRIIGCQQNLKGMIARPKNRPYLFHGQSRLGLGPGKDAFYALEQISHGLMEYLKIPLKAILKPQINQIVILSGAQDLVF